MVIYRELLECQLNRELFRHFIRRQVVTDCWRRVDGRWTVRPDPFVDDWSEEDFRVLLQCLKNTVCTGGFLYAAFWEDRLKGFVSVESALFGGEQRYLDLTSIHVSADMRGQGVGQGPRGAEAVYLRPLRRGDPALLPGDGLHGGGGVLPGARGGGAL